jgi:hypothetical protein
MVILEDRPLQLSIPTDHNSDIVHYVDSNISTEKALCGKYVGDDRWAEESEVDCVVCLDLLRTR